MMKRIFLTASLLCGGQAMAMPQDSTIYYYTDYFSLQACYFNRAMRLPLDGLQSSMISELRFTVYSDPVNYRVNVDAMNRPGSYVIRPPYTTTKRDRGGDAYLQFYGDAIDLQTQAGCAGRSDGKGYGLFQNWPYTGRGPRWLKLSHVRPGNSASSVIQPFAVKTRVVPIGSFSWNTPGPYPGKVIPNGEFGLNITRVVDYRVISKTDPGSLYTNPNSPSKWSLFDMIAAPSQFLGAAAGYFSEDEYGFLFHIGNEVSHRNRTINRGYVIANYLDTQCSDGTGSFTGTNVGSRSLTALNYAPPWGSMTYSGCHGIRDGVVVIENTGDNIWTDPGSYDKFRFVHKGYSGNRNFIVRVDQLENTNPWARAGIMLRTGTGTGDAGIGIFVTPGNGIISQFRTSPNDTYSNYTIVPNIKAPIWLRLDYVNGVTRTYSSTDGVNWGTTPIATYTRTFSGTYQAGLAAASRSNYPNTSVYSGLSGF